MVSIIQYTGIWLLATMLTTCHSGVVHSTKPDSERMEVRVAKELQTLLTDETKNPSERGLEAVQLISAHLVDERERIREAFKEMYKTDFLFMAEKLDDKSEQLLRLLFHDLDGVWGDMIASAFDKDSADLPALMKILVQTWDEDSSRILSAFSDRYHLTIIDDTIREIKDEKLRRLVEVIYKSRTQTKKVEGMEFGRSFAKEIVALMKAYETDVELFVDTLTDIFRDASMAKIARIATLFQLKSKISIVDAIEQKIKGGPIGELFARLFLYAVDKDIYMAVEFMDLLKLQSPNMRLVLSQFILAAETDLLEYARIYEIFDTNTMMERVEQLDEPLKSALNKLFKASEMRRKMEIKH